MENDNLLDTLKKDEKVKDTVAKIEALTKEKWKEYKSAEKEKFRDEIYVGLVFCDKETRKECLNLLKNKGVISNIKEVEKKINTRAEALEIKPDDQTESNVKKIPKAVFPGLVDIAVENGKTVFLIKEGAELLVKKEVGFYIPPQKDDMPWELPRAEEVLKWYKADEDSRLFDDLIDYHSKISDLPKGYYILMACWDFHTYMLEAITRSPIIMLFAVPERGKTRTGKGMINVAYRGVFTVTLRESYLFRLQQNCNTSIFFDVTDINKRMDRGDSEDVICGRFEKGMKVARVNNPEKGPFNDIDYYNIFGPTIIATNIETPQVLESRAITIPIAHSNRKFNIEPDNEIAITLRERLTAFRARHLGEKLEEIEKPFDGRLGDISKPLFQVIGLINPEKTAELIELLNRVEKDRKSVKAETIEGRLTKVIDDIFETEAEKGVLSVTKITDAYNKDFTSETNKRFQLTYARIGRRLDAMGFEKCRLGNGKKAILVDRDKIKALLISYGFNSPSEPSEPSELASLEDKI